MLSKEKLKMLAIGIVANIAAIYIYNKFIFKTNL